MIKLSYEEAVAKIKENSSLSDDEIKSSINAKMDQFAGLVSKEGAAHILANELGIKLIENVSAPAKLKVKDISAGMQNVEVLTKVLAVYQPKEFNSNGRAGKVGSAVLGDETGTIRGVFWNEQANQLSLLNKGDIIKLKGVYTKQSMNGRLELHFNNRSMMVVNPPGESVEAPEYTAPKTPRKKIAEIADSDSFVETLGTVIEVFDIRFFEDKRNSTPQNPVFSYVMSVFLDDGSATMRVAFFRDAVQKLLNKSHNELLSFRDAPQDFEPVKNEALGSFIKVSGRVNKNEAYNRVELIANSVEHSRPEDVAQPKVETTNLE